MGWFINTVFNRILGGLLRAIYRLVRFLVGLLIDLAQFALATAGRVAAAIIGLVLIVGGVLLSLTGILAIVGVPLGIIGSFILVKAILP